MRMLLCRSVFCACLAVGISFVAQAEAISANHEYLSRVANSDDKKKEIVFSAPDSSFQIVRALQDMSIRGNHFRAGTMFDEVKHKSRICVVIYESHEVRGVLYPPLTVLWLDRKGRVEVALSPTANISKLAAPDAILDDIVFFNQDKSVAYPQPMPPRPADCRDIKSPSQFTRSDADPAIARAATWDATVLSSIPSLDQSNYYVYSRYANSSFQLVRLGKAATIGEIEIPEDSLLSFDPTGRLATIWLGNDSQWKGVFMPTGSILKTDRAQIPYYVVPSSDITLGQFGVAAKRALLLFKNGNADTFILSKPYVAPNFTIPALSEVDLYPGGGLQLVRLTLDQIIHGIPVTSKAWVCFRQDGELYNATLSSSYKVGNTTFPAGTTLVFDEGLVLRRIVLSENFELGGIPLKANSWADLHNGDTVRIGRLSRDLMFAGLHLLGGETIWLFPSGKLDRGTLAEDTVIQGFPCMAGTAVGFDEEEEQLNHCTVSRPFMVGDNLLKRGEGYLGTSEHHDTIEILDKNDMDQLIKSLKDAVVEKSVDEITKMRNHDVFGDMKNVSLFQADHDEGPDVIQLRFAWRIENMLKNVWPLNDCDCNCDANLEVRWIYNLTNQKFIAYIPGLNYGVHCPRCPSHNLVLGVGAMSGLFSPIPGRVITDKTLNPTVNSKVAGVAQIVESGPKVIKGSTSIRRIYLSGGALFVDYSFWRKGP